MRRGRVIFLLLVVSVLLLAGALRFVHLRSAPGWYSDEGVFIHFAEQLQQGHWQTHGIESAFSIQRLPLFPYLLALAFTLSGTVDIGVARAVSVLSSLVGLVVLMVAVRRMVGPRLAFWAGLFLALLPWVVAYQRLALTYNLTGLWMLIFWAACWWMLNEPNRPGWLLAAISAGLALATDFLGAAAALLLAGLLLVYQRRRFWPALGIGALTVLLVALPALLAWPNSWTELQLTLLGRGAAAPGGTLLGMLLNLGELFRRETWVFVGLSGLALLPERRARNLALALVGLPLLLLARSYTPVGRGLHYLLHLFPFFALGLAVFFDQALCFVRTRLLPEWTAALEPLFVSRTLPGQAVQRGLRLLLIVMLFASPWVWMLLADAAIVLYDTPFLFTGNDELNLTSAADADRVADYLRQQVGPQDLVVASPQIVWLAPGLQVDYQAISIYEGQSGSALERVLQPRFAFPCALRDVDYAILDPLARDFAPLVVPGMEQYLAEIETWPLVFQSGALSVYRAP